MRSIKNQRSISQFGGLGNTGVTKFKLVFTYYGYPTAKEQKEVYDSFLLPVLNPCASMTVLPLRATIKRIPF